MRLDHTIYTHEKFTEQDLHWCPESEAYAGGSHLITALRCGWRLAKPEVKAKPIWKNGTRLLMVYCFALTRGHQTMCMPVLGNPYVERYLIENRIRVMLDAAPGYHVMPE